MAAPRTLIPADIPSMKDVLVNSYNPKFSSLRSWAIGDMGINLAKLDTILGDCRELSGNSFVNNKRILDSKSNAKKAIFMPSISSATNKSSPLKFGNDSYQNMDSQAAGYQSHKCLPTPFAISLQRATSTDSNVKEMLNVVPHTLDNMDADIFSKLNPSRMLIEWKAALQNKPTDSKMNSELPRNRESIAASPRRTPLPMWTNHATCDEVPRTKQYDVRGQFDRSNSVRGSSSFRLLNLWKRD